MQNVSHANLQTPPGPRSFFSFFNFSRDRLAALSDLKHKYGDVAHFKLFGIPAYLLSNPDHIEEVLVTQNRNFTKNRALQNSRVLLGNGLLTSEGDFWRRQRRLAQPAFHRARIAAYAETMVEYASRTASAWRDGQQVDIHKEMMRLTLEIVAKTLFNSDVSGSADEVRNAMEVVLNQFIVRARSGFLIPAKWPTPGNLRMLKAVDQLDNIIYTMIAQRRQALQSGQPDPGDLLSMLLSARDEDGSGMDDRQLRDEAMTLFLAGHETTAILLSWTWYLLSQNPQVEDKLVEELRSVLGGRPPQLADLPALRYTGWVINEALRLYPPAWVIGRQAVDAFQIGEYELPARSIIMMSQWIVHHDERFFKEPMRFNPGRWDNDFEKMIPRFAFFPFGGGPRQCIGNNFAIMEASLVLATLAQHFHASLLPGFTPTPWPSITLRPKDGIQVILMKRNGIH